MAVRGGFLGLTFGIGYLISCSHTTLNHFGWYLMGLSFFHFSEYLTTAATNPSSLTLDSYLLDHSREYKMAAVASWLEFFVEWYIAPGNALLITVLLRISLSQLVLSKKQCNDICINLICKFQKECIIWQK